MGSEVASNCCLGLEVALEGEKSNFMWVQRWPLPERRPAPIALSYSSLIVGAQCLSSDCFTIKKEGLYRVIC